VRGGFRVSGLCGILAFDGAPVSERDLEAMVAAAPHRSRDGTGRWQGAGASLAHLATWLTPQDEKDSQPLARGGLVIAAHARIDNRDELVPELVRRGYLAGDAGATSDAEVILAAHRHWGDEAPARLIGDFAYLLWDVRRRRLLAARDPMGMRPLYYRAEAGVRVLAASELKQLLAVRGVPCAIDERSLAATIAGPFLQAGSTVYAGIGEIPPGHLLIADPAGVRDRPFWSPDASRSCPLDSREAVAEYRERLGVAVADRLRARAAVGLMLSGGLDSGSIASMAGWLHRERRVTGRPLRTFSWAFPSLPDSDERAVSGRIVEHYGLEASAIIGDDLWPLASYPDHAPDRDDPYLWVYQALVERTVAVAADGGVGVLLSGDRGDELLGDWVYDELGLLRAGRLRPLASDLRIAAREQRIGPLAALRRHLLWPLVVQAMPRVAERRRRRSHELRPWAPWVPDEFARRVNLDDMVADARRLPRFDGYARSLRHQRLFLAQAARVAVLHERTRARFGVGYADPFTDRRLVELVLALPQWRVQRRGRFKHLAREGMRGFMPEGARRLAAKTIPNSLFERGFRERSVDTVRSLLSGSMAAANGWLDAPAALGAYEDYVRTGDSAHDFWWPLTVEMWLRRWWA
jgi:asparagine synthase (glutamine-hydrolysing)